MAAQRRLALLAQPARAILDDIARDLRHPRRRRAGPRRERKHVKLRQAALVDQVERAREHVFGLGRKARNDVAAERHVGPQPPHLLAERNGVGARMPALHALEDQVVAGLQRQMQMRHQPRLIGERVEQVGVGLDRIDRGQSQPLEFRHVARIVLHQRPSPSARRRSW